jgi:hypothetical protein
MFLLGMLLVQLNGPISAGIGTSLIAAAVTGWVVFVYVFQCQTVADRLNLLTRFGLKDAFESRSVRIRDEYHTRLQAVTANIDVLGFGQRALREDYAQLFASWSQKVTVRILLVDPEYPSKNRPYADQRDTEEGNAERAIRSDVKEFVKACSQLIGEQDARFQVRLYTCLPSVNIFRIDNALFWGPYLIGDQSRNLPTFLVESGGLLFDRLLQHFNRIWQDERFSRQVPGEWLDSTT